MAVLHPLTLGVPTVMFSRNLGFREQNLSKGVIFAWWEGEVNTPKSIEASSPS
jgi:hypothetical protein